jgi:hypothetical protein
MRLAFDIEATGLLNESTVDYTASPFKLKDDFKIHCAVFLDIDSGEYYRFVQDEVYSSLKSWMQENVTELIGNNIIDYDLLVLKAALGIDYTIYPDTLMGKPVKIWDNMVISKALNPDRPAHSVDYFGNLLGYPKIDWRAKAVGLGLIDANAANGEEFLTYHPAMLEYNTKDAEISAKIFHLLMKEWGTWNWTDIIGLESAVRDIITRQSHRGFWFDKELAEENVRDLDRRMEEIRAIVEPILPPKPLGKTKMKEYTPPKTQFLKSGAPSTHVKNFVEKHEGKLWQEGEEWKADILGTTFTLPIPVEPIITTEPATVRDTTHIKGWLVSMGWKPTQYKERDLSCDSKKKKLSPEKYKEAVERYVEQTLASPFCKDRLEELGTTKAKLMHFLLSKDCSRPIKVYTNPTLTVGMEKEVDPALLEMADQFPHTKLVSEYLTYSHRRNSILGGGFDPDDDDEEATKGFLATYRESDGRIATPADTCGAGTSRFKHRLVANIPRVTSNYGDKMRAMFGVDKRTHYQLGYDFDSLEAKIESHYVFKYEGGIEYGVSLTAEKPNDCHSVLAKSISELLGKPFPRGTAKNVKYGCSYNAQPARVAKTVGCDIETAQIIFDAFWTQAAPLKELKENMQKYWETTGQKKFLLGGDGRKLPIRSKGNVINTAFQSLGVICAKRAMVIHDRKLKASGMLVDFWKDDWKNMDYCQQLIAYHDEAQLEVSKKMVKWKLFATEDEAKAFKKLHPTWSDVGHSEKGYYVGWCKAGELAIESVREAGQYYKLNVELTAGYMLGTNWATCH